MPDIQKIFCNTCNYETKHERLSSHDRSYYEVEEYAGSEQLVWHEDWEYSFFVCRGCDTATLQEKYHCVGMYDNNGDDVWSYTFHPERTNRGKREPLQFLYIDKKLNQTYREVIKAYHHGLDIVTAMGVRALLEGICVCEGVCDKKAWGLGQKIEGLKTSSNIPGSIIEGLKSIKFIGDDAAHRLKNAQKTNISLAIDLIEALLTHLYEAKFNLQQKADLAKQAHNKKMQPTAESGG